MKRMRRELRIGLFLFALYLALRRFYAAPELLMGIVFGIGLCLILIGSLSEKRYTALKNWKKTHFK